MADPDPGVVQGLLAEVRELKVERARLHLELKEVADRRGRPDPRIRALEKEVERLREELARAREERDVLSAGMEEALERLSRASSDR